MRSPIRLLVPAFLVVLASLAGRAGPLEAQLARDVCALGVRLSSARAEAACLDARRLPFAGATASGAREGAGASGVADAAGAVALLGAGLSLAERSAYPVDRNEGALWSGRGWSSAATFGVVGRVGALTVALEPEVTWSENRSLALPDTGTVGLSRWAYPWGYGRLDWYLRPGAGPLATVGAGNSFVELRGGALRAGASNERLWWGPARRYPLLFSGTAPGFPHVYAGTSEYLTTPAGGIGFEVLWGRLEESAWFDADPRNDLGLLGALQLRWRSDFVPGLEVSYAVARHEPLPGRELETGQLAQLLTGDPEDEDAARRGTPMGTLSVRFAYPEAGFEAYAEIGRGEGFFVPDPGVSETRVSQVYLLGFARTDTLASGRSWRVAGEALKQELSLPQPSGVSPPAALAGPAWKGHTHRGQLLGPYTGPASNAQYVALDFFGARTSWGAFAERVRRDDDTYFRTFSRDYGFRGHDVEWTLGARSGWRFRGMPGWSASGPISIGSELGVSRRKNRSFVGLDGVNRAFVREWNVVADVWVRWGVGG